MLLVAEQEMLLCGYMTNVNILLIEANDLHAWMYTFFSWNTVTVKALSITHQMKVKLKIQNQRRTLMNVGYTTNHVAWQSCIL